MNKKNTHPLNDIKISVDDLYIQFNMASEKVNHLKEYIIVSK